MVKKLKFHYFCSTILYFGTRLLQLVIWRTLVNLVKKLHVTKLQISRYLFTISYIMLTIWQIILRDVAQNVRSNSNWSSHCETWSSQSGNSSSNCPHQINSSGWRLWNGIILNTSDLSTCVPTTFISDGGLRKILENTLWNST